MPFTEYWPADLPRSLIERIAASDLFTADDTIAPHGTGEAFRCGPDLHVELSATADAVVLAVVGPVDLANAVRLRALLLFVLTGRRPKALVLDASGITLASVRGLTVLVEAGEAAAAVDAGYAVAGLSPLHLRMVHEIRPGQRLAHLQHGTVPEAVAAVRADPPPADPHRP